ncbi:hypothetical protein ACWFQ7_15590, partial [Streptomyces bacillaris]
QLRSPGHTIQHPHHARTTNHTRSGHEPLLEYYAAAARQLNATDDEALAAIRYAVAHLDKP